MALGVAHCDMIESGDNRLIWNLFGREMLVIFYDSCGFHKTGLPDLDNGVTLHSKFSEACTVN